MRVGLLALALVGLGLSAVVGAASTAPGGDVVRPWNALDLREGWTMSVGLTTVVLPEFNGSDSYRMLPLPLISAEWEERLSISPLRGVQLNLLPGKAIRLGPVINYSRGRSSRGKLSDFERVSGGFSGGAFVAYRKGPFQLESDVTRAFSGGLEGYQAQLDLRLYGMAAPGLMYSIGPALTWSSHDWAGIYYDVSAADAGRSGLPEYSAGPGFTSVRLGGSLTYIITRKASITAFGSAGRLVRSAADSPIVKELGRPQQGFAGLMLLYRL